MNTQELTFDKVRAYAKSAKCAIREQETMTFLNAPEMRQMRRTVVPTE